MTRSAGPGPGPGPDDPTIEGDPGPAGGWGSLKELPVAMAEAGAPPSAAAELRRQNKPEGYACVSCAWAKPAAPHVAEFCENGAKATFWELTSRRVDAGFVAQHSLSDLLSWPDHDLEKAGRLVTPLRLDRAGNRLVPVTWAEAFAAIGPRLAAVVADDPDSAVFYTSGRASLEASFMWQLFARLCGTNNLPDSANMCHESSSVGLKASIGTPVGTARQEDLALTDTILALGHNIGTTSPRMLRDVAQARKRGVPVVVVNPLRERGWEEFIDPQRPVRMLTNRPVAMHSHYLQPHPGGDIALVAGICKWLIEEDDHRGGILDHDFLSAHTLGLTRFAAWARDLDWGGIEATAGVPRVQIERAAQVYAGAGRAVIVYGMGLTQHRHGTDTVRMLCNLAFLRGNIGRPGTGLLAVRGHSNVQGQRTVGIACRPEQVPLAALGARYGFVPPQRAGLEAAPAFDAILQGKVRAFLGLGGNLLRAAPDRPRLEAAWPGIELTVQILTKLNRSALVGGKEAWVLPCLGRIEADQQASGAQTVTVEDGTARIHASKGRHGPADPSLLSEPAIIAGLAEATLPGSGVPWREWVGDYALIRAEIEALWPEIFADFESRMDTPGGFDRPLPANERRWDTPSRRAEFHVPPVLDAAALEPARDIFRLTTLRSNDQFNTTIYGMDDRLRGISGTRQIVMMAAADMDRLDLKENDVVTLETVWTEEGAPRCHPGLHVVAAPIAPGALAGYFPELNDLVPLDSRDGQSHTPAYKAIPVRVLREGA